MLWEILYWNLVDDYGFDEDLINGVSGNNLALQLVLDGMKFQPCAPSFIDARNAILIADYVLIWSPAINAASGKALPNVVWAIVRSWHKFHCRRWR